MDNLGMNIGYAILLALMLFFIWPRANEQLKNAPKGSMQDWLSVIKPLIFVIVFIIILIMLLR